MNNDDISTTSVDDLMSSELRRDLAESEARGRLDQNDVPRGGWHPVNTGQLVMGLAFVTFVVLWALLSWDVVPEDDFRWLLPVPWVLGGVVGLLAVSFSGYRRRRRSQRP